MSSLYGLDSPLLHVTYLEDLVMVDGELVVRTAFLFDTAVLEEPVTVSAIYTPPGDDGTTAGQYASAKSRMSHDVVTHHTAPGVVPDDG